MASGLLKLQVNDGEEIFREFQALLLLSIFKYDIVSLQLK